MTKKSDDKKPKNPFNDKTKKSWTIFYYDESPGRKSVSLPQSKFNRQTAEKLLNVIQTLVYYRRNGITVPEQKILNDIAAFPAYIHARLVKAGFLEKPEEPHTCKELWDCYLANVKDIEESTFDLYERIRDDYFFRFFKEKELLTELELVRFEEWKDFLIHKRGLAGTTISGVVAKVKAVFNWAVKKKWLQKSPVKGLTCDGYENRENDRFIEIDEYNRLLDACNTQDWRCIIALARIGGLRAPSEVLRLEWSDIDWENNQFFVKPLPSKNPKRKKGKIGRWVPLFPELRAELEKLFVSDESDGTGFVIARYAGRGKTNLGTQFARIAKRAKVGKIPRPFDNMRASRSTEIFFAPEFGPHKESKWIGHTIQIARKHYIQIRDDDYAVAANWVTPVPEAAPKRPAPQRSVGA